MANTIGAYPRSFDIGAYESAAAALTASGTPSATAATAAGYANATNITITDVNTTESWTDGNTGLVITGSGFV